MSLLKRFKPVSGSLPTAEQTGLAVDSANHAVSMLEKEPNSVVVRTSYAYNKIVPRLVNTLPRMEWERRRDTSRSVLGHTL